MDFFLYDLAFEGKKICKLLRERLTYLHFTRKDIHQIWNQMKTN